MYQYRAQVVRVIDGDTVVLMVDLGFDPIFRMTTVRMAGINAPDAKKEGADKANASTDALRGLLPTGSEVVITTFKMPTREEEKHDDWRRYLAVITTADGTDVNKWMLVNNFAVDAGSLPA